MPRAIWSGSISFGLVNVPVRMYSAIDEHDLHFNLLHEPDSSRIGYQKVCKKEEKPVPDDEIVKAYEVNKGKFVVLSDEDFESVQAEGVKSIDISDFVPYDEIDPIYFERTYYLGPQDGAEKVYALLRQAMEDSGLAAIATYVMRERQHLGCLRVREGTITLERMFFHDEIRPVDEIRPRRTKPEKRELEMAASLIDQFSGSFDPAKYQDTYQKALMQVIRAKQKGKTVKPPQGPEQEEPVDLLDALRASLEAAKGKSGRSRGQTTSRRSPALKPGSRKRASTRR
jgi:DNA end-binding protein Ku